MTERTALVRSVTLRFMSRSPSHSEYGDQSFDVKLDQLLERR